MKIRNLMIFSALCTLMSCAEDITENGNQDTHQEVPTTGVAVQFGGQTSDATVEDEATAKMLQVMTAEVNAKTRAYYGDASSITKWDGTNIYWNNNDQISIVQAAWGASKGLVTNNNEVNYVNYTLNSAGGKTVATFTPSDATKKMEWYANAKDYRFVATYPAINSNRIKSVRFKGNGNGLASDVVEATIRIPKSQTVDGTGATANGNGWMYLKPDMNHCYMIGVDDKLASNATVQQNTNVHLKFQPIMTTLLLGVRGQSGADVTIERVRVYLRDKNDKVVPIPNEMTVSYQTVTYANGQKRLVCNKVKTLPTSTDAATMKDDYIEVTFANTGKVVSGTGAVVPIFLPPLPVDANNYHYQFVVDYVDNAELFSRRIFGKVASEKVNPSAKRQVGLPYAQQLDFSKWMEKIPNNTLVKTMSLPGSHMSALLEDINYNERSRSEKQYSTITEQLNAGVRVFDLRMSSNWNSGWRADQSQYGTIDAKVTRVYSRDKTDNFYTPLLDWLKNHPTEGVIIICSNQGAYPAFAHEGRQVMRDMLNRLEHTPKGSTEYQKTAPSDKVITWWYDGLDMQHLRGKIAIIYRPSYDYDKGDGDDNITPYDLGDNYSNNAADLDRYGVFNRNENTYTDGKNPKGVSAGFIKGWIGTNCSRNNNTVGDESFLYEKRNTANPAFKIDATYYSYKYYKSGEKTIGATPYWYTKVTDSNLESKNTATMYVLDKEFLGGKYYVDGRRYVVKYQYPDGGVTTYGTDDSAPNLYSLKNTVIQDFLDMAADPTYQNDWFVTVVPGFLMRKQFDDSSDPKWIEQYHATHLFLEDPLRARQGRQRFGIMFMDFVPGKDDSGKWQSTGPTFSHHSVLKYQNRPYSSVREVGKRLNNLIVLNNFMGTTRLGN